jgi:uncharacterized protein
MPTFEKTPLNRVRRIPDRGIYDHDEIYAIVDAALICHVGIIEEGQPFVIPTIHGRDGDTLYLHGAKASRMLKYIAGGAPVCITFTHLDGLVVARSVFESSMNYRSAILFGRGEPVTEPAAKLHALAVISDHLLLGRWQEARLPTQQELDSTAVVAVAIENASAKTRSGPPADLEADYALPIWAGVLPFQQQMLTPIDDPRLAAGIAVPAYIADIVQESDGE